MSNPKELRPWILVSDDRLGLFGLEHLLSKTRARIAFSGPIDSFARTAIRKGLPDRAILLVSIGNEDLETDFLHQIAHLSRDFPVVLLLREIPDWSKLTGLPQDPLGVIDLALPESEIRHALGLVQNDHRVLPCGFPQMHPSVVDLKAPTAPPARTIRPGQPDTKLLTARELEVTRQISKGFSNKEIARLLGISVNTVNVHVGSIRRKLGVHNRTQVAICMQSNPPHGRAISA